MNNFELEDLAAKLKIRNFKGVFMRDEINGIKNGVHMSSVGCSSNECGIINFNTGEENDRKNGHWAAYYVENDKKYFFDSYGSPILPELKEYLGRDILTHDFQIQNFNTSECGAYCILFLYLMSCGLKYEDIVLSLAS